MCFREVAALAAGGIVNSIIMQNKSYSNRYKVNKHAIIVVAGIVLAVAVVVFIVLKFVIGFAFVSGNSMVPTYSDGQLIFFNRMDKEYDIGDIIAMNYLNGDFYIKRVVALGGDVVEIKGGSVYVNDVLSEYGGETAVPEDASVTYPYTVPEDSVFVMGDNRGLNDETGELSSVDSRSFGAVKVSQLLGTVME